MSLRQHLRRTLPESVVRPLRRGETYARRLWIWKNICLQLRGVTARDRAALRRSLLGAPMAAARSLDEWRDPLLLEDAEVEVRGVGRFHARARTDDLWHVLPAREAVIVKAIRERLRPGDTFVDAGANIGFYTVMAAHLVGPRGRVIAFEMMPDTAAILRRHVEMNGLTNVTVVEQALSERAGEAVEAHVVDGKFGQASLSSDKGGRSISVATTTLDLALSDVSSVRLMKMDIEGAEERALRGAEQALGRIENLVFESWDLSTAVDDLLATRGFAVRALDGRNRLATRD
ncbi:MAG TPA: FkbM family methyltransferase [Caulobacteraceae bacterium]|nr:FkbM family methyltransferase [Caulobacteraceae bacterium]